MTQQGRTTGSLGEQPVSLEWKDWIYHSDLLKLQLDLLRLSQSLLQHRKTESTGVFHAWESSLATHVFGFAGILLVGVTLVLASAAPWSPTAAIGVGLLLIGSAGLVSKAIECGQYKRRKREWARVQARLILKEQKTELAMRVCDSFLKQINARLGINTSAEDPMRYLGAMGAVVGKSDENSEEIEKHHT